MIQITNDWILKPLPNNAIQTPNTYTNNISCECFEPLVNLRSNYYPYGTPKYIESSTGISLPVYQPAPDDVSRIWGPNSTEWAYFASSSTTSGHSCRGRFDPKGQATARNKISREEPTQGDTNNWIDKFDVCFSSNIYGSLKPVEFKFFDPETKTYKKLNLRCTQEYKNYLDNSSVNKRTYKNRWSYFWEDDHNNRTYIFESQHFNIMPGDDYPYTGYALINPPISIYLYTDIGFDIINEKWVGLLNLYLHLSSNDNRYAYFSGEDTVGQWYNNVIYPGLSSRSPIGPFESISQASYANAVGAYSGLIPFYSRAFELEDFEPDIQNITLPMTKIGCYGPNTRIVP